MGLTTATPRAGALAAAMREARERSGLGVRKLAGLLGVSHSTVVGWERGRHVPAVETVSAYLALVGVTGDERERILDLARGAAEPDWLAVGIPGIGSALAGVMECERTATRITDWSPMLIPGLLQTSDYARAVIGGGDNLPRHLVETRVTLRLGRRDVLTRPKPAHLVALIGLPAIRQCIGGRDVMLGQLRYLLDISRLDTVTVRLVDVEGDWHPGLMGPFTVYDFPSAPSIVHLEHHRSGVFLSDRQDVEAYRAAIDTVTRVAMSPAESAQLIATRIADLQKE